MRPTPGLSLSSFGASLLLCGLFPMLQFLLKVALFVFFQLWCGERACHWKHLRRVSVVERSTDCSFWWFFKFIYLAEFTLTLGQLRLNRFGGFPARSKDPTAPEGVVHLTKMANHHLGNLGAAFKQRLIQACRGPNRWRNFNQTTSACEAVGWVSKVEHFDRTNNWTLGLNPKQWPEVCC